MDQDDFDQTQAIAFDDQDLDDDTDDLAPDGDKKPASFLKIPLQKGLNETSYPLYEGDNIIGRSQDTCHIHIASKSLSKEHACIQIVGDVHMIFDKSSRNKTRRGKLFLSPEVRYELKNNEEITFADVKCIYQIASEIDTVAESGSETEGSESLMLKYDVTNETSVEDTQNKGNLSGADAENNNDDSVLPPTQSYPAETTKSKVIVKDTPESNKSGSRALDTDVPPPTLVLSESESSDEEAENGAQIKRSAVKGPNRSNQDIQNTLLCEDSDPESSRDKYQFAAATQAYGIGSDDESSRHSLIGAATQAYVPTRDDSDDEVETDKKLMHEPTQAFAKPDCISEDASEIAGTQSFKLKGKDLVQGNQENVPKELDASDSSAAATQVFEEEDDDDNFNGTGLFAAATMACDDVVEEEDETDDEGKNDGSHLLDSDAATQVFDSDAPTQKVVTKRRKETQADTLVVKDSCDAATVPIPNHDNKSVGTSRKEPQRRRTTDKTSTADLPTQVISAEAETMPIKDGADEGQNHDDTEEKTQVFAEETVAVEDIVDKSRKVPVGRRKGKQAKYKPQIETELETVPVQDSITVFLRGSKSSAKILQPKSNEISDTMVIGEIDNSRKGQDDPTQLFNTAYEPENGYEKKEEIIDEPTQDFANSSSDLPTQVFSPAPDANSSGKGSKQKPVMPRKPAGSKGKKNLQPISSDEDDDTTSVKPWMAATANEPNQAYSANEEEGDTDEAIKNKPAFVQKNISKAKEGTLALSSDEDDDIAEKPSQTLNPNEPTQAYGVYDDDIEEHANDHDAEGNVVGVEEPTQAYCLVGEDDAEETKEAALCEETTQVYGLCSDGELSDDPDADATQPFDNHVDDDDNDALQRHVHNDGPTQKYDMAVREVRNVLHLDVKSEEAVEDSEDDSDLEETSVLQMDQVAEVLAESPQKIRGTPISTTEEKKSIPEDTVKNSELHDEDKSQADPPLSPEIADKSNESTPVFAMQLGEKDISDTEEMVPDSMANSDGEDKAVGEAGPIIPLPLPARSPLKSALVDRKRSPSPARKHVNFTEPELLKNEKSTETNAVTRGGRDRRPQTTGTAFTRGRLTKDDQSESEKEMSCKDPKEKQEACDSKTKTMEDKAKTKHPRKGRYSKQNVQLDGTDKEDVIKEGQLNNRATDRISSSVQAQGEETSISGGNDVLNSGKGLPSRSSQGRKRRVNESSAELSTNVEANPEKVKSSENLELEKTKLKMESKQNTSTCSAVIAEEDTRAKLPEESIMPKENTEGLERNASVNMLLVNEEKKEEQRDKSTKNQALPQGKTKAAATKGSSTSDQDPATGTPEGRRSSRGRRITTSNHFKDYDTSTNPRGRVSRSSMHSSPVVNAKSLEVLASDQQATDVKPETKDVSKQACSTTLQSEESETCEMSKAVASVSDTEIGKRGRRGRLDIKADLGNREVTQISDNRTETGKEEKSSDNDVDNEVKAKTTRRGGNTRRGNKSMVAKKDEAGKESMVDTENIGKDSKDSESTEKSNESSGNLEKDLDIDIGNEFKWKTTRKGGYSRKDNKSAVATDEAGKGITADSESVSGNIKDTESLGARDRGTKKKTKEQFAVKVTEVDEDKMKDDTIVLSKGKGGDITENQKNNEMTSEEPITPRKKGRKSALNIEDEIKSKKSKPTQELTETEKNQTIDRHLQAEEFTKQHRQSKIVEQPEEKVKQKLACAGSKENASTSDGLKSSQGRVSRRTTSSKTCEVLFPGPEAITSISNTSNLKTLDNLTAEIKTSEDKPVLDIQENENNSAATRRFRGCVRSHKPIAVTSKPAVVEHENHSSPASQGDGPTVRVSSRQRSKAPFAENKKGLDQEKGVSEKLGQNSQSSGRGSRGAGRLIMSEEGLPEGDSQSSVSVRASRGAKRSNMPEEGPPEVDSQGFVNVRGSRGAKRSVILEGPPEGDSQSSVSVRGSRGAKRSVMSEGPPEGDSQSSVSVRGSRGAKRSVMLEGPPEGDSQSSVSVRASRGAKRSVMLEGPPEGDSQSSDSVRGSRGAKRSVMSEGPPESDSQSSVSARASRGAKRSVMLDGPPEGDSQSSVSVRASRGAKRSILSTEGFPEGNGQSPAKSLRKESGHLLVDKKQAGRNSSKVQSEPEKVTSITQSQPSPSPVKKSRRSSPPPSTPSRKAAAPALAASPVSSPSLRKSTLNHQPKVMFTGVIDDQGEKIVKELGGELVTNIQDCTHLITDKVRRTVKFLGGLAKGALIVTPQWLENSKRARTFLDGNKFLVRDPAMEKQYRFSLQSSIERASTAPLLRGYSLHVTPSVRPDPSQMKDILQCAGATYLNSMPLKSKPETVVISCPEDQSLWSAAAKAGVPVVGAEFVLTGLLRQELEPQTFSLIKAEAPQTSKGRGRHK